jgi:hypothetical protein
MESLLKEKIIKFKFAEGTYEMLKGKVIECKKIVHFK